MNKQLNRLCIVGLLVLFMFILTGCSGVPGFKIAPNPTVNETDLYTETVYIRNCADFENEKRTPMTEEAPIVAHVVVADQATSEDTGEMVVIPKDLKEKLQSEIEKEYEDVLQEKQTQVEKTDLVVPAYSIRIFDVLWKQQCTCSTVVFEMEKQIYTADYSYKLEYPMLDQTMQMACTA